MLYAEAVSAPRKVWLPVFGSLMQRVRIQRQDQGRKITPAAAARRAKVDPVTILHLERGETAKPDPVLLSGLADLYRLPISALIAVIEEERSAQREHRVFSLADAEHVVNDIRNGPSPEVAKAALAEAQAAISDAFDVIAELLEVRLADTTHPTSRRQAPTPRRRTANRRNAD